MGELKNDIDADTICVRDIEYLKCYKALFKPL